MSMCAHVWYYHVFMNCLIWETRLVSAGLISDTPRVSRRSGHPPISTISPVLLHRVGRLLAQTFCHLGEG